MKKKYKIVKEFRFWNETYKVGIILEQDEDGDYIAEKGEHCFPAAFVDNCPEYFELVKAEKEGSLVDLIDELESCNYECVAGKLENHTAFIALKEYAKTHELLKNMIKR